MAEYWKSFLRPVIDPLASAVETYFSVDRQLEVDECWMVFGVFFAAWGVFALAAYKKYAKSKGEEYASRVVSWWHAVVSTLLCGSACLDGYHRSPQTWGRFGLDGTGLQQIACLCSAGYFTVDMIGILCSSYFDWLFIGHHVLCGGCLLQVGFTGFQGFDLTLITSLLETSNPLLHGRWLLIQNRQHLKGGTFLYNAVDGMFYVVFIFIRMFVGPQLTYFQLATSEAVWVLRISGLLLQIYSIKFMLETGKKRLRDELWQ